MEELKLLDGKKRRSNRRRCLVFIVSGIVMACVVAGLVVVEVLVVHPNGQATNVTAEPPVDTTAEPPADATTEPHGSLNISYYVDDLRLTIDATDRTVIGLFYKSNRTDKHLAKMNGGMNGVLHTGFLGGSHPLEMRGDAACGLPDRSCLFDWHLHGPHAVDEETRTRTEPEAQLTVKELPRNPTEVTCFEISWKSSQKSTEQIYFEDCYDYSDEPMWYGAFEHESQPYGLRDWEKPLAAFIPGDGSTGQWGGVMERYFLGWSGFALHVDWRSPLFVSVKDNTVCLRSQLTAPYQASPTWYPTNSLFYHLCSGPDIATTHKEIIARFYAHPATTPRPAVFQDPVWSVPTRNGTSVTQQSVLQLVKDIADRDFTASSIELDGRWAAHYGDVEFDKDRFENATEMVRQIHAAGMSVTLWVSPYVNNDSRVFEQSVGTGDLRRWLRDAKNPQEPLLVKWKHGTAAVLDLSGPAGVDFLTGALRNLSDSIGVDGFTFEAGEAMTLGTFGASDTSLSSWRWQFTRQYASFAASAKGAGVFASRFGCSSQELPVYARALPRRSSWSSADGLQSVVPAALSVSLAGYPFTWPEVVGGSDGVLPDRELFTRWVQLSAFLPVMHFSVPPWRYDEEVVNISRRMMGLHRDIVAPYLLQAAAEAQAVGYPIIRPLWWICPYDVSCATTTDQFLIGDRLLVAPVVNPGDRQRRVYLPLGQWRDHVHNSTLNSIGQLSNSLTVGLDEILHFTKL